MKELLELIYEAEEIQVVKDGDLKLPVNELVITSYDKVVGYAGRARKPMVNWVTEYNYVSEKNLTQEEFDKIIDEQPNKPYGQLEYTKKKLTFGNGKVYYRHILKAIMF